MLYICGHRAKAVGIAMPRPILRPLLEVEPALRHDQKPARMTHGYRGLRAFFSLQNVFKSISMPVATRAAPQRASMFSHALRRISTPTHS